MAKSTLGALGKKRALDVLDFLERRSGGARFGEVSKQVANSVPSAATQLLAELEACGAVTKDMGNDHPRYRLTSGGRIARRKLHEAIKVLERECATKRIRRPPSVGPRIYVRGRNGASQ
jgi:DNA-binding HxlR family transcriptional regulator